jgi:hypothetical protein
MYADAVLAVVLKLESSPRESLDSKGDDDLARPSVIQALSIFSFTQCKKERE